MGKARFAISVDGGATTQIDLRDKLISTSGVDSTRLLLKVKLSRLLMLN